MEGDFLGIDFILLYSVGSARFSEPRPGAWHTSGGDRLLSAFRSIRTILQPS